MLANVSPFLNNSFYAKWLPCIPDFFCAFHLNMKSVQWVFCGIIWKLSPPSFLPNLYRESTLKASFLYQDHFPFHPNPHASYWKRSVVQDLRLWQDQLCVLESHFQQHLNYKFAYIIMGLQINSHNFLYKLG